MKRRLVRINVTLPDLTAAQADLLWNFLEDLSSAIWDAYETDILGIEDALSREIEEGSTEEHEALIERCFAPPTLNDPEPDPQG